MNWFVEDAPNQAPEATVGHFGARTKIASIILIACTLGLSRVQADFALATGDDASNAILNNKGVDFSQNGKYAQARRYLDATIARAPRYGLPYYNRALISLNEGKLQLALQDLETVLRIDPTFWVAVILRGFINEHLGRYRLSLADYDRLLSIQPLTYTRATALCSRAWLEATCPEADLRNGKQAVIDARAACNIRNWNEPNYIDTLAAAHAEAGDFASAIKFEQRAISALPHGNDKILASYQHRLSMYQQHRPYHR